MRRNIASQIALFYAHDTLSDAAKTGDSAQITVYISKDGAAPEEATNAVTELDSTNMPGIYAITMAQAETNCNDLWIYAKSTSAGVYIAPVLYPIDGNSDLLEADWVIDTSDPTQYQLKIKLKGTSTVLFTKDLKDISGNPIISTLVPIGQQVEA